jgi:hypothetical protein
MDAHITWGGSSGGWGKLHNEEFHNLYSSSGDQIKEDETEVECSTHGRDEVHTTFLSESLKERDHSRNLYVNGIIILEK